MPVNYAEWLYTCGSDVEGLSCEPCSEYAITPQIAGGFKTDAA